MCVCLFLPKDLANCWTDWVHLYRVASIGPGTIFLGGVTPPTPQKMKKYPLNFFYYIKFVGAFVGVIFFFFNYLLGRGKAHRGYGRIR